MSTKKMTAEDADKILKAVADYDEAIAHARLINSMESASAEVRKLAAQKVADASAVLGKACK